MLASSIATRRLEVASMLCALLHFVGLYAAFGMPLWIALGRAGADMGLSIVAGAFLLHSIVTQRFDWCARWDMKLLLAFWLLLMGSTFMHAVNDYAIIKSITYIRFILCYAALRYWLFHDRSQLERAGRWALPVFALVVFDTWWQYVDGSVSLSGQPVVGHNGDRLTGPLNHANIGKYMFSCLLPMAVVWFSGAKKPLWFALCALVTIAGTLLIPLSGERSISIMLVVSVVSVVLLLGIGAPAYRRHAMGLVLLCVIGIAALSTQPVISSRLDLLIEQVQDFRQTPYGQLFQASLLLWQQSPIVGQGAEAFEFLCLPLMDSGQVTYCDLHPHNLYLQLLMTVGVIGFMLMLLWFARLTLSVLKRYIATPSQARLTVSLELALLLGFLFPIIVTQDFFSNWPAALYWYSLALILSLATLSKPYEQ